jgi:hypothetical protein
MNARRFTQRDRLILIGIMAAIAGFAIGALWQYTSARSYQQRLDTAQHELELQRLGSMLGGATAEAQRGGYEIARRLASDFFSGLQAELARADAPPVEAERRRTFDYVQQHRDGIITALSRNDPQSGSMLAELFVRYRIGMGDRVSAPLAPAPPQP